MERKLTVILAGEDKTLGRTLDNTGRKADGFGSKMSGMSGRAKTALLGLGGGAVLFAKSSISAFSESEEAQSKLSAAYAKFPQLAGGNITVLQRLNEELAKKTKFDDDATASGQAVLAGFGLTEAQLVKITPLLQDYAERTGKDIPSAAQDLGKTILGQGRAMKGIGLNFKDAGSKAANFDQLMGGLTDKVGGFAKVAGTTGAGKAKILSNQFGELQEKVGAFLIPALMQLADIGLKVVDFISGLNPGVLIAIGVVAGLAAAVYVIVQAQKAWTAAQLAFNIVMNANPVMLVVIAVAAFVAGLVIAYQKVEWFRNLVDGAFKVIQTVISTAFNFVKSNWPLILGILTGPIGLAVLAITKNWDTILGFFRSLPGNIAGFFVGLADLISAPFRAAFQGVKDLWNDTAGGFGFSTPGWIPGIGGKSFHIPSMAQGAFIPATRGGVIARLAEAGRGEFALPEPKMEKLLARAVAAGRGMLGTGGGRMVNHNVVMLDGRVLYESWQEQDDKHSGLNG